MTSIPRLKEVEHTLQNTSEDLILHAMQTAFDLIAG